MAIFRGIFVPAVLVYLAGLSGTLTVLLLLVVVLGAFSLAGRGSPAKKPASIVAAAGTPRPKLVAATTLVGGDANSS